MPDEFTVAAFIPALPMAVYMAWLEGARHAEMTGADAHGEARVGSAFDSWDGYIHGTTTELDPGRRIVQRWRTAEFPGDAPDSLITITLGPEGNGTRLSLKHTQIPEGQGHLYEQGWHDHYFRPMQEYFINAGISGVPAGASVTEILHRVSTGEATPSSPSLPVFREPAPATQERQPAPDIVEMTEVADATPSEIAAGHGKTDFELADDEEGDDFDTAKAPAEDEVSTGSVTEDFWKHLDKPAEKQRPAASDEPLVDEFDDPGRRPARRQVVGAGKPGKGATRRKAKFKPATREGKPAKAKPAKSKTTKARNKSPERQRRVNSAKRKKSTARARKATKNQGPKKKPAIKKKAAAKKPKRRPSRKARPAGKKPAKKSRPKKRR